MANSGGRAGQTGAGRALHGRGAGGGGAVALPGPQGAVVIGGPFVVMAGPCAVEPGAALGAVARAVAACGCPVLRGGAFKPRTSPHDFQGMGAEGLQLLVEAARRAGLCTVSEVMDAADLPLFDEVDILQVGARNMQNFSLLKALAKVDKPVLLKRGLSATVEEWLLAAEYLLQGGNERVVLCERGIRTFETATRNTLDLGAVAAVKQRSRLPVIVDPSHAAGRAELVPPLALAAAAAGADGLLVEVHEHPGQALCDGKQALRPAELHALVEALDRVLFAIGRDRWQPAGLPAGAAAGAR